MGLQLAALSNTQRDELALLIAERTVVFFRDQDSLTPQAQRDLGAYFGEVEVHPSAPQVPGLPGVSIIWDKLTGTTDNGFRNPFSTQDWHTGKLQSLTVLDLNTDRAVFSADPSRVRAPSLRHPCRPDPREAATRHYPPPQRQ